jgi:nicotinamide-nucleotide amidase
VQEEALKTLQSYFEQRGRSMPPTNIKQAHLIPSAQFLPNRNGTAPGWWVERQGKIIVAMPGPPAEMHPIWEEQVEPRLRQIVTGEVTLTRNIKTLGLSEAEVDAIVSEFFGRENPYLGIYSKADGIHLRLIARARDVSAAQVLITPIEDAIVSRLSPYVWGYDDDTPERAVGKILTAHGWTLATMDCCTGGYLANSVTEVPDSVAYFKGGVVAYSPEMLMATGVPAGVLQQHGMVSQASATAMAQTIRTLLGADFGMAVVGAPGPGALENQPAGLAYLAIANASAVQEHELRVPPRRVTIKRRVANTALIALCKLLRGITAGVAC